MRVLIVDDHPITRDGIRSALAGAQDLEVVGEATTGEEAIAIAEKTVPDVVFMDVRLPGIGGLEATKAIRSRLPGTKIIMFTVDESRAAVMDAVRAGVSGYLLKDVGADELINAARLVAGGKAVIHPALTRAFLGEIEDSARGGSSPPLSRRESE